MTAPHTNWAGNHTYHAARVHEPETIEELQRLVAAGGRLKALGSRHSFNDVADTPGAQISLARLGPAPVLDPERRTVTVGGGIRYGELARELHRAGFALHNLASLPHISVAGACATATHGSGNGNGNLATAVRELELVVAGGERVTLSRERDGERFNGAVVHLGALGVVSQLTLDVVPAFEVRQDVYLDLPLDALESHFDAITGRGYSVSLFTDWQTDTVNQVWVKRLADGAPSEAELFGARPAPCRMHPIAALSAEACTEQRGIPGPWHERLPHFRLDHTPSAGEELQSEYFVARQHALAAVRAVAALRERLAPLLLISEVRTIAADSLWMSPCYGQACVALHFTWKKDWPAVRELLPELETRLAPLNARPHWGKLFTMPPERLDALFPRLADFRALARAFDPRGQFRNTFLERTLGM
jgi:xylitol oxidase